MDYTKYRKWLENEHKGSKECTSDIASKMFLVPLIHDPLLKQVIGTKLISEGILDGKMQNYFNNPLV